MKKIILLLTIGFASCQAEESNITTEPVEVVAKTKAPVPEQINTDSGQLFEYIDLFENDYLYARDRYNLSTIVREVDDFRDAAQIISKSIDDDRLKIHAEKLQKELLKLQIKEFPELRKQYANISRNRLWEDNVKVYCGGDRNERIVYTGGAFADNAVKRKSYEVIQAMLEKFRFKSARFEWFSGDDDPKTYTITSLDDDMLW